MPDPIEIGKFGLLDTSMTPADIEPARGRVCHDLIVSEKGRIRSLSKRPGYEVVTRNALRSVEEDLIDECPRNSGDQYYSPYHKCSTIHYDDAGTHTIITSIIFNSYTPVPPNRFCQIQFFKSVDGGNTWSASPITFDASFKKTYSGNCPYFDYELATDGTNIYVIFWYKQNEAPSAERIQTFKIPLTSFDMVGGDQGAAPAFTGLPGVGIISNRTGMGNACSIQYSEESGEGRVYTVYPNFVGGGVRVEYRCFRDSGALLQSANILVPFHDLVYPIVRYNSGIVNIAVHADGPDKIVRMYSDDESTPTPTFSSKEIGENDPNRGFSYQIVPQLEPGGETEHVFLSEQAASASLSLFINSETADTVVSVDVESSGACMDSDDFDIAVLFENTYKPLWRVVILWDKSFGANGEVAMRMTDSDNYDGSTINLDAEYIVTSYSNGALCRYNNINGSAYITKSGSTYTLVSEHAYFSITRYATDDPDQNKFRFLALFSDITIEALIQVWREEDGTLQMICQASDNKLYQIILSDADPAMFWEELEDALSNVYADGGGRFRNHAGIIRMASGNGSTNLPAWYGYIKREFFQKVDEAYELSVEGRRLEEARLDRPEAAIAFIENVDKTLETDNLGTLLHGLYEYKLFLQYDGFQYSLPQIKPNQLDFTSRKVFCRAADTGDMTVGWTEIPVTGHGASIGDTVRITDTVNYDGDWIVVAVTDADNVVIEKIYIAETFSGGAWFAKMRVRKFTTKDRKIESAGVGSDINVPIEDFGTFLTDSFAHSTPGIIHMYVEGSINYNGGPFVVVSVDQSDQKVRTTDTWRGDETMTGEEEAWCPKEIDNSPAVDKIGDSPTLASIPVESDHKIEAGDQVTIEGTTSFDGSWPVERVTATTVVINMGSTAYPGDELLADTDYLQVVDDEVSETAVGIRVKVQSTTGGPLNPRLSGAGLIRRHRNEGELNEFDEYKVVGFAPIGKGENVRWWSGEANWDQATTKLDIESGIPSLIFNDSSATILTGWGFVKFPGTFFDRYGRITAVSGSPLQLTAAFDAAPPNGRYRYEIIGRWHFSGGDGYHLFMDTGVALTETFRDLAGFSPDLDSIEANYRDRCVVNGRSFFAGVMVNPGDADLRETFDDTVIYGALTGDGQFTQDVIDPGKFLNFGRGDGDNISRIFAHAIGSDEAGESAIEVLAILKQSNVYLIDVAGLPEYWKELKKFRGVGCLGRDCVVQVGAAIYFLSRDGIKKLQGLEIKDVQSYYRLDGILKDFTDEEFRGAVLGYIGSRDWLLVSFPDRTENPKTMFYDLKADEWGEFRFADLPIIYTEGHGNDAVLPGGTTDLDQKMFSCDGTSVFLHPSGTTDDGTKFTAQWINAALGKFRGLMQWMLKAVGATHYTEPAGADGSIKIVDETDVDLSELTLTAVASSSAHPEVEGQQILNGRADSFELEFNVDEDATRADLDSVVVEYDTEKKLL